MEHESAWCSGNVCLVLSGKQGFKYRHGSKPGSGAPSCRCAGGAGTGVRLEPGSPGFTASLPCSTETELHFSGDLEVLPSPTDTKTHVVAPLKSRGILQSV